MFIKFTYALHTYLLLKSWT